MGGGGLGGVQDMPLRVCCVSIILYDKDTRAMFALLRRGRQLQLPVDIMMHLFDTLVKPILLYGSS